MRIKEVDDYVQKNGRDCYICNNTKSKKDACLECRFISVCSKCEKTDKWINYFKDDHKKECKKFKESKESVSSFYKLEEVEKMRNESQLPTSLNYMKKYPIQQKSWFDLDFTLFNSALARLQQMCNCRAGVQLPGVCKHVGCCILGTYSMIMEDTNEILQKSKRDLRIWNSITDLTPWSKQQQKYGKQSYHQCPICRNNEKDKDGFVHCDKCGRYYHYSCAETTRQDVEKDMFTKKVYYCIYCSTWDTWVVRNTPPSITNC